MPCKPFIARTASASSPPRPLPGRAVVLASNNRSRGNKTTTPYGLYIHRYLLNSFVKGSVVRDSVPVFPLSPGSRRVRVFTCYSNLLCLLYCVYFMSNLSVLTRIQTRRQSHVIPRRFHYVYRADRVVFFTPEAREIFTVFLFLKHFCEIRYAVVGSNTRTFH